MAKDGRLAFSLDGDITAVGGFAKRGNVAMTSASAKRVLLLTKALSANAALPMGLKAPRMAP